ncbi:hypothetical protein [Phenylobacterium deserti]|uniref:Uncharacterized protein n=1 Tax=Phenylobacterium deserti TaxID=1914756 RepID=A0A328AEG2_9CAUL|nr:hypothetical protein [Phenylobacterium deserti]RAK52596.1 hypothetical protein DJ018_10330 [Phenylobacterium deserti]
MIWIKASRRRRGYPRPSMLQTYELFLETPQGERRFEPVTCATPAEALRKARLRLEDGELAAIEVRRAGEHLFTLKA